MDKLTIYETARVIGIRALQLSNGATPMVPIDGLTDVLKIAEKELYTGKMPIIIRRKYPDGTYKDIKVSDLIVS
jgi:DNA-directed RNA polymerase subunit K/omega